jgi:hypothetical protein
MNERIPVAESSPELRETISAKWRKARSSLFVKSKRVTAGKLYRIHPQIVHHDNVVQTFNADEGINVVQKKCGNEILLGTRVLSARI